VLTEWGHGLLDTFRKTFYLVGRANPGRWLAIVLGAVVTSGLEMIGALLVYLLLAIIASPSAVVMPFVGDLRTLFGGTDESTFLLGFTVTLGLFFLARAVVQVAFAYAKQRVAHNAAARVSTRLAAGYLRLPYAFHLRRRSSELVRNAHQTPEDLSHLCFLAVIQILSESLLIIGMVAVMVLVAPLATVMAVAVVGAAAALLLVVVQPRLRDLGEESQEMRARSLGSLQQALHGIRDIKVFGGERQFAQAYGRAREALARAFYLRGMMYELPRLVIETALIGFILLLFALSVRAGTEAEELLSTLGLFAYAGMRLQPSIQKTVSGLNTARFSAAGLSQVYDDLRMIERAGEEAVGSPLPFQEEIRLESVSFTYEAASRPALRSADLVIREGEVVGLCGPTGGGKTTLTDLLIGVLDPTEGRVLVDGVDVASRRNAWFAQIGIVPQMVFLVDDTLRRNIALGVDDEAIDEVRLREAVEGAQLGGFVASLPDGLETVVGERGVRISGGQRQRVAIARALYRRPSVLVLDEGTSALDTATEAALMAALHDLRAGRTIILVAHRLSSLRECDRIVYLEGGRIGGVGQYDELERSSAGFRALTEQL
jgi:ATP-binding cassette, subfamily B, bacterial PglK